MRKIKRRKQKNNVKKIRKYKKERTKWKIGNLNTKETNLINGRMENNTQTISKRNRKN